MTEQTAANVVGIWITHLIKLAGVVLALHEGLTTKDPAVIGLAGAMLAGGQGIENFLKGVKA
jgi:hypothetical protein